MLSVKNWVCWGSSGVGPHFRHTNLGIFPIYWPVSRWKSDGRTSNEKIVDFTGSALVSFSSDASVWSWDASCESLTVGSTQSGNAFMVSATRPVRISNGKCSLRLMWSKRCHQWFPSEGISTCSGFPVYGITTLLANVVIEWSSFSVHLVRFLLIRSRRKCHVGHMVCDLRSFLMLVGLSLYFKREVNPFLHTPSTNLFWATLIDPQGGCKTVIKWWHILNRTDVLSRYCWDRCNSTSWTDLLYSSYMWVDRLSEKVVKQTPHRMGSFYGFGSTKVL